MAKSKITQSNLAAAAGVTRQAVHKSRHISKNSDGSLNARRTRSNLLLMETADLRSRLAQARLRELTIQVREGKLVDREATERQAFDTARIVRDGLLSIPDRVAALVAAETDTSKVHSVLTAEIRKALTEVSNLLAKPETTARATGPRKGVRL